MTKLYSKMGFAGIFGSTFMHAHDPSFVISITQPQSSDFFSDYEFIPSLRA